MGEAVVFTIHGKPFGKQRPRFSGHAFTPAETVSFESLIRETGLRLFPKPIEGPVRVTIIALFQPAASWSKKRRAEVLGKPHIQKPDLDNIEKAVLDGLNRVAFADDGQVAEVRKVKRWAEQAQTFVKIEAIE